MSDEIEIESVNKNYLDKVMDLAEEKDVAATEDIFDARGIKLIAKGAKISRGLQEKLILHKLRKPLESSIAVEGGVNIDVIVAEAKKISETLEPVSCVLKTTSGSGPSALETLSGIQFGNAMSMMLTIVDRGGPSALTHSVMVSLVSICLAKKLRLSESEQTLVALAGMLHDIGELYIEPEYLNRQKRLLPHEWRQVIVHPRVGQMLIGELENYPPAVALAVAEHHERFDGSGYPRQVAGKNISVAGQVLSVAETISSVFMHQDRPLERAELAMKIIPGEHAHDLVSAISCVLRVPHQGRTTDSSMPAAEAHQRVCGLFEHIGAALEAGKNLLAETMLESKKAKDLLLEVLQRITTIQRGFSSTGLDVCLSKDAVFFEPQNMEILFEVAVATREIEWRLRDVARDLALRSSALENHEADVFQPLIALLDHSDAKAGSASAD
jgi:HD-GYP domain-containing protein (c-di-GMP phosphodiesterase class II)